MATIKDRLYQYARENRIPLTGAFELTPMCNFSCKMCYVRRTAQEVREEGGLKPLEFWLDLAEQAKEAGTMFPLLTGGETFLYPHIRELNEALSRMGMQVSINSNGSAITEEVISWLKETPPTRVNITLYGGSNESYERLCGDPEGFDKVRRGVQLLADNQIRFRFNCSLTPDNVADVDQMVAFAREYGRGIRTATYMFPPVRRTGKSGDYEARFTPEEAGYYQVLLDWKQLPPEKFAALARNARRFTELTPEILAEAAAKPPRQMGCLSGRCSYWVDWQGNLSGCGMMDIPRVSLSEYSLKDAWQKVTDWTENLRYSPVCGNCPNRSVCFSCAAMVYNETGSFDGRPVYLCEKTKYAAKYYKEFLDRLPEEIREAAGEQVTVQDETCTLDET
ncbi:MAG TPA: radical SAM protein [Firmicutes bacterium]|nr:radical SAM protein [Bacillota bacterium]